MSDQPLCGLEHPDMPGVRCAWQLGHDGAQHGARYNGDDGEHYAIWSVPPPEE